MMHYNLIAYKSKNKDEMKPKHSSRVQEHKYKSLNSQPVMSSSESGSTPPFSATSSRCRILPFWRKTLG
jgi:hypothetical protein